MSYHTISYHIHSYSSYPNIVEKTLETTLLFHKNQLPSYQQNPPSDHSQFALGSWNCQRDTLHLCLETARKTKWSPHRRRQRVNTSFKLVTSWDFCAVQKKWNLWNMMFAEIIYGKENQGFQQISAISPKKKTWSPRLTCWVMKRSNFYNANLQKTVHSPGNPSISRLSESLQLPVSPMVASWNPWRAIGSLAVSMQNWLCLSYSKIPYTMLKNLIHWLMLANP